MSALLQLTLSTPTALVAATAAVRWVRAEDESGSFAIHPGHADFLTVLTPSVISWRERDGAERHAAILGGTLRVAQGRDVAIAARDLVLGDDLAAMKAAVLTRLTSRQAQETASRSAADRLRANALKRLADMLRGDDAPLPTVLVGKGD